LAGTFVEQAEYGNAFGHRRSRRMGIDWRDGGIGGGNFGLELALFGGFCLGCFFAVASIQAHQQWQQQQRRKFSDAGKAHDSGFQDT
jgi:hypothetical protein